MTINIKILLGLLLLLLLTFSCKQKLIIDPPYTIMFYNVENLFDTISNPNKLDYDFLPDTPKEWNTQKYLKKLNDLARVIVAVDSVKLPIIIGVCEVENNVVLNDLVNQPILKPANYQVVWNEGPDIRGIDCALLYNPSAFTLINFETLKVSDPDDYNFITRDILYVEGLVLGEVLHIFINHWPSRRGGVANSEPKRILAANVVRKKVDEIFSVTDKANIIIMGDMNDEPTDMSISDILVALPNNIVPENHHLVNLMYDEFEAKKGTYNYSGNWNMIDNIIVSGFLINKTNGLSTDINDGKIFHQSFMEFVNNRGEMSPNRTYGRSYYGGISDHFPVYLTLYLN